MVRYADIHQLKYLNQSLRKGFVGLAGCRLAGRMVMGQYHRRRIEIQGALNDLPGMHLSAVNRAGEERLMSNKLVLVVGYNTRNSSRSSTAICSRSHSRTAREEVKATPGS